MKAKEEEDEDFAEVEDRWSRFQERPDITVQDFYSTMISAEEIKKQHLGAFPSTGGMRFSMF